MSAGHAEGLTQLPEPKENSGIRRARPISRPPISPQKAPCGGNGISQLRIPKPHPTFARTPLTFSLTRGTKRASTKTADTGGAK